MQHWMYAPWTHLHCPVMEMRSHPLWLWHCQDWPHCMWDEQSGYYTCSPISFLHFLGKILSLHPGPWVFSWWTWPQWRYRHVDCQGRWWCRWCSKCSHSPFGYFAITNLDCLFVLSFPYDSSTHNLYYLSSILFCSGYFCVWLLALYLDCLFALSFSYDSSTHYLDYLSSILFCGGYFCVWPVDLADLNFVYAA